MTDREKKNDYLQELFGTFAVIHNITMKEAVMWKKLYDMVSGAKNALEFGEYDDLTFEDFKNLIDDDLKFVYDKR